ncbi:MAG: SDR family NAD(P)-dependent oxidoreductase [Rickettsiales bacterium]|jgi:pteridine reductase|nr:SDR family NAD(P)-dependent oxidoreductase [Rickettsiales bacterium]
MTHTILITGAARRLGRNLALFLAKERYNIALTYNKSREDALSLQQEIMALNVKCKIYQLDFEDADKTDKLIELVYADFSDLKVLINNASIFAEQSFLQASRQDLMNNFNVHLFSPLMLSQSFANIVGTGKIINITDLRVKTETPRFFPYLLSKKSLSNLTLMLAKELEPAIEVNEIRPGILLKNDQYDPAEDLSNELTKRQNIESFYAAVKDLLDNKYYGRQVELGDEADKILANFVDERSGDTKNSEYISHKDIWGD